MLVVITSVNKTLTIMDTKFYYCPVCGNVLLSLVDSGMTPQCCGQEMQVPKMNTIEGKFESHVPKAVCKRVMCDDKPKYHVDVLIGSKPHPMTSEHHISFIVLETKGGGQLKFLAPGGNAEAHFISCYPPLAVYAFCNMHGLWSAIPVQCPAT